MERSMTNANGALPTDKRPLYLFLVLVTVFAAIGYALALSMGDDNLFSDNHLGR